MIQSGKTSAHLFCAAPLESFSRALVGLLNEIEHEAKESVRTVRSVVFNLIFLPDKSTWNCIPTSVRREKKYAVE